MDSRTFQFNKMAGAVLGTALAVMVVSIVADVIYAPAHTGKPGFVIATAAPSGEGQAAAAGGASTVPPIAVRLQTADVAAGKSKTGVCRACHTFDKGQPAKVGPNLYGVVGSPAIHHGGFKYSEAMQKKGAAGLTWTFENLDNFLTSPKAFVPGTLMTFAGLKNPKDRANVIAYLNSNSDKPLALPSPGGAAAGGTPTGDQSAPAAGGTPAGGTTPAGDQQTPAGGTTPQHSTELPAPAGAQ